MDRSLLALLLHRQRCCCFRPNRYCCEGDDPLEADAGAVVVAAAANDSIVAVAVVVADYCCTLADRAREWIAGRLARCPTVPSCRRNYSPPVADATDWDVVGRPPPLAIAVPEGVVYSEQF